MGLIQDILARLNAPERLAQYHSGRAFEEIYEDQGAFRYDREGFTLHCDELSVHIQWDDITQLRLQKRFANPRPHRDGSGVR